MLENRVCSESCEKKKEKKQVFSFFQNATHKDRLSPTEWVKRREQRKEKRERKKQRQLKKQEEHRKILIQKYGENFYTSKQWRALRYEALRIYGRVCALCRDTTGRMHVDHIKPRSLHPELELEFSNLQILCEACNLGKSNQDSTDFRSNTIVW